jgi:hypothetical protein
MLPTELIKKMVRKAPGWKLEVLGMGRGRDLHIIAPSGITYNIRSQLDESGWEWMGVNILPPPPLSVL